MTRSGLGIGVHYHCSRPEFLRAHSGVRDGLGTRHTRRLRRVAVQLAAANDTQAVILPVGLFVCLKIIGAWIVHGLLHAIISGDYIVIDLGFRWYPSLT